MTTPLDLIVDSSQVAQRARTFPDQARALTITDDPTYRAAGEFLKGIKALRGEIADTFDPHIGRAFNAHRELCIEKRSAEAPLAEAERITKDAMLAYNREQERLRLVEEERLRDLARQEAAERQLDEAVALDQLARETGDPVLAETASRMLDAPVVPLPVVVPTTTPKVAGIAARETWSGRLIDIAALIRHAGANPQFMGLLMVNQPALNALARSMRARLKVPGVEAICTKDIAAGRR